MPAPPIRPKIALVLSSGGLNPLAAIPLLEFLEANGIRLDLLVGCSGGSLTLGLLACGYRSAEIRDTFRRVLKPGLFRKDWMSIAIMLGLRRKGFSKALSVLDTRPILAVMRELVGDRRLEDLPVPLVLQATDFDTGQAVEIASGPMAEGIYASCAAYPFLHPIQIDGRWLFDGVFSAPMPILPAVRRGMDLVIAVDFAERLRPQAGNFLEAMSHLQKLFTRTIAQSQMLASIDLHGHNAIYVKVRFNHWIQIWEMDAFDRILEAGHAAVEEYGPEILAEVQALSAQPGSPHAPCPTPRG